jgi:hypothetical protein
MACTCDLMGVRPGVCDYDIGIEHRQRVDLNTAIFVSLFLLLLWMIMGTKTFADPAG